MILSDSVRHDLEKILFNRAVVCKPGSVNFADSLISDCLYQPHHCIVFYNASNTPISFVEVCFICEDIMADKKVKWGAFCGDTYCDLKNLFSKAGIDKKTLVLEACPGYKFE